MIYVSNEANIKNKQNEKNNNYNFHSYHIRNGSIKYFNGWFSTFINLTKMKTIDFTIDKEDLKVLYVHTRFVYPKMNLDQFIEQVKKDYTSYVDDKFRLNPKTFSQWVNGQNYSNFITLKNKQK